jgi:hypothetical protein
MGMPRFGALLSAGIVASVLGLSGCGSRAAPPARYAGDDARAFVREHRAELETEITVGSGPRLYDLAIIAGCQDLPALNRRLHKRRDNLFAPAPAAVGETTGTPSGAAGTTVPPSDEQVAERVVRFMGENAATSRGTPNSGELRCLYLEYGRQSDLAAGRRHIGPLRGPTTARGGTP